MKVLKKFTKSTHDRERVEIFHVLTNMDSTSLKFMFISDTNSEVPEDKFSDIIIDVIIASKMYKRFDSSHTFWDIFGARKEKRKKLGYYEIENIDNSCLLTMAVNPKEYLELLKDRVLNKKHKGIKKGSAGLGFENFAQRIKPLVHFNTFEKPVKTVTKSKISQLNDKRFYFPDGVVSLPLGHPLLKEIDGFKQEKGQKIERYFWKEKENLFNLENKALKEHPRLYLYHQVLMSTPKIFNISQKNNFTQQRKTLLKRDTKDIVLEEGWIMK